jgi:hypothetical protein
MGKYSLTQIQELGQQLESEALAAQAKSPLSDSVDRDAISRLLTQIHLQLWSAPVVGRLLQKNIGADRV